MAVDLFGCAQPRAAPRVLMHIDDSGIFPDGRLCGHFRCRRCGCAAWLAAGIADQRRGLPCPTCNPTKDAAHD